MTIDIDIARIIEFLITIGIPSAFAAWMALRKDAREQSTTQINSQTQATTAANVAVQNALSAMEKLNQHLNETIAKRDSEITERDALITELHKQIAELKKEHPDG